MSRYNLNALKPEHRDYEITVGWDGTLGNFFGEVRRPRVNPFDLGGEVVVSVAEHRDATYENLQKHLHAVVAAISPYAVIDGELQKTLWADSRKEGFGIRA